MSEVCIYSSTCGTQCEDVFFCIQVFIITEGSVSNKHECVEYVTQRSEFARLFPIGIGESCERAMIAGLSRAGNGKPHFLKVNEKPYNTVSD